MTDSFGARLRRERERRQVLIADIAARTKIKASLFEAIERDDASHWPSGIFRRSFMRAYAEAIGLDGDATIREFLERFPDPAAPSSETRPSCDATPHLSAGKPTAVAAVLEHGAAAIGSANLRLTLVETGLPFTGGRFLADAKRRWSAAAWDLGTLIAIAVSLFVFLDVFWMPFGITALCYYVGGILFLGNTPGVCLFAPQPEESDEGGSRPARVARPRAAEPPIRSAEPVFRTSRFRADRHREVRT